jgi:hypothetical protein
MSYAKCGRPRAIELAERVRPILDALYAEWRAENPVDRSFEFAPERDACMRLLSRIASHEEITKLLGDSAASPQLAASGMHEKVWGRGGDPMVHGPPARGCVGCREGCQLATSAKGRSP